MSVPCVNIRLQPSACSNAVGANRRAAAAATPAEALASGVAALAKGGGFGQGNVIPFAGGGTFTNLIVNQATPFRFANGGSMASGVMGEAGPEAIVPLKRGSYGRLGIASQGGSGSTVISFAGGIHITVPEGTTPDNASAIGAAVKQAMVQVANEQILKATRQRGILNRAS